MKLMVSIHDVMPESLDRVVRITEYMDSLHLDPAPLLVSPGCDWSREQLRTLKTLFRKGHEPAGHGWLHHASAWGGLYHRLHGLILSRRQAEHLALDKDSLKRMVADCHAWFSINNLPAPKMYVPPAWAMGDLNRKDLGILPFRWYETLSGIYDSAADRLYPLPLTGFQADTTTRKVFLGVFNRINLLAGRLKPVAVRVAVHPHDFQLRLADQLQGILSKADSKIGKKQENTE